MAEFGRQQAEKNLALEQRVAFLDQDGKKKDEVIQQQQMELAERDEKIELLLDELRQ